MSSNRLCNPDLFLVTSANVVQCVTVQINWTGGEGEYLCFTLLGHALTIACQLHSFWFVSVVSSVARSLIRGRFVFLGVSGSIICNPDAIPSLYFSFQTPNANGAIVETYTNVGPPPFVWNANLQGRKRFRAWHRSH